MKITKKKIIWGFVVILVLFILFDLGVCVVGETYGTSIYSFNQKMYCNFNDGIYTKITDDNCCDCSTGTEGEYNCFPKSTYNQNCG